MVTRATSRVRTPAKSKAAGASRTNGSSRANGGDASSQRTGARQPPSPILEAAFAEDRARRHRLTPERQLRNIEDAAGFLEEMGLLLQTPHPYLPALFSAAQGKPAKPGARGFGQWPEHAWSWAGELAEREDVVLTKVVLGRRTLVHRRLWPALDAALRGRPSDGHDVQSIIRALRSRGTLRTDELREVSGFGGSAARKRYDAAMSELEATGIVLCRPVLVNNHEHVAVAELWESRFPKPLRESRGPTEFIRATIVAAGSVPTREVPKWFAWPRNEVSAALERLVSQQRLRNADGWLVSS